MLPEKKLEELRDRLKTVREYEETYKKYSDLLKNRDVILEQRECAKVSLTDWKYPPMLIIGIVVTAINIWFMFLDSDITALPVIGLLGGGLFLVCGVIISSEVFKRRRELKTQIANYDKKLAILKKSRPSTSISNPISCIIYPSPEIRFLLLLKNTESWEKAGGERLCRSRNAGKNKAKQSLSGGE